jgi:hypothetical protein
MQLLQASPTRSVPPFNSDVAREYLRLIAWTCTYGAESPDEREVYACLRVLTDIPAGFQHHSLHVKPVRQPSPLPALGEEPCNVSPSDIQKAWAPER